MILEAKESIEKGVMLWLPQMKEADKSGAGLDPVEVLASHKTPNVNPTQRYYSLTQISK